MVEISSERLILMTVFISGLLALCLAFLVFSTLSMRDTERLKVLSYKWGVKFAKLTVLLSAIIM